LQRPILAVEWRSTRSRRIVAAMTTDLSPAPAGSDAREAGGAGPRRGLQRVDATAVAWALLAVLGLAGFVAMTVLTFNHFVWPFDQPLLAQARQWAGDGRSGG
jgi:hypothetical protein